MTEIEFEHETKHRIKNVKKVRDELKDIENGQRVKITYKTSNGLTVDATGEVSDLKKLDNDKFDSMKINDCYFHFNWDTGDYSFQDFSNRSEELKVVSLKIY